MELSPPNPSFLDMRNAILQADLVVTAAAHDATIWQVFAHRGMGYFAGTLDGSDTGPVANFALPPAPRGEGLRHRQRDRLRTHAPVRHAHRVPGLDSGFPGNAGATTAATGGTGSPAAVGPYPYLFAGGRRVRASVVTPFALAAGVRAAT